MDRTMSLRGLGRLIGVDDKAIRKALTAGVFSDAAVRRDERGAPEVVNATIAVQEWERSGRQLRGQARRPAPPPTAPPPVQTASAGVGDPSASDDPEAEIAELLARVRRLREGSRHHAADGAGGADGTEPGNESTREDAETSPTLVRAQTDAMVERGRKLRMENDLREGTLVEADQAARQAFEFSRTVRENVLNVPARVSAELAAESDASRVHLRLEQALREALLATAGMLEQPPAPAAG